MPPTHSGPISPRLTVLVPGLVAGVLIAIWMYSMSLWHTFDGLLMTFGIVFTGPAFGTWLGIPFLLPFLPIHLGWLGLVLIPLHPREPNWTTAILTSVGFCLWYAAACIAIVYCHLG
jgi:hypothetical protein